MQIVHWAAQPPMFHGLGALGVVDLKAEMLGAYQQGIAQFNQRIAAVGAVLKQEFDVVPASITWEYAMENEGTYRFKDNFDGDWEADDGFFDTESTRARRFCGRTMNWIYDFMSQDVGYYTLLNIVRGEDYVAGIERQDGYARRWAAWLILKMPEFFPQKPFREGKIDRKYIRDRVYAYWGDAEDLKWDIVFGKSIAFLTASFTKIGQANLVDRDSTTGAPKMGAYPFNATRNLNPDPNNTVFFRSSSAEIANVVQKWNLWMDVVTPLVIGGAIGAGAAWAASSAAAAAAASATAAAAASTAPVVAALSWLPGAGAAAAASGGTASAAAAATSAKVLAAALAGAGPIIMIAAGVAVLAAGGWAIWKNMTTQTEFEPGERGISENMAYGVMLCCMFLRGMYDPNERPDLERDLRAAFSGQGSVEDVVSKKDGDGLLGMMNVYTRASQINASGQIIGASNQQPPPTSKACPVVKSTGRPRNCAGNASCLDPDLACVEGCCEPVPGYLGPEAFTDLSPGDVAAFGVKDQTARNIAIGIGITAAILGGAYLLGRRS